MVYDPQRDKNEARLRARIEELECEVEALKQNLKACDYDPIAALMQHYKIRPRQAMMLYAMHHGRQVSHESLLQAVTDDAEPQIITVYVCNLRKALRTKGSAIKIETIWGRAYQITEGLDELRAVMHKNPKAPTIRLDYMDSEMLR